MAASAVPVAMVMVLVLAMAVVVVPVFVFVLFLPRLLAQLARREALVVHVAAARAGPREPITTMFGM